MNSETQNLTRNDRVSPVTSDAICPCRGILKKQGAICPRRGVLISGQGAICPHRGVLISEQGALQQSPVVVLNEQGFSHTNGRERVKKLGHAKGRGIRLATWNIGTLTSKTMELVDVMRRRKINIACLQETKWRGGKARELEEGYKLLYSGSDGTRNGVAIVVDLDLKDNIVNVRRISDRILSIKLALGREIMHIISAYAPQVGLDKETKKFF